MNLRTGKSQRDDNNRIKYLFVVVICCLAIGFGVQQVIAAYISISNMKAVASTNENESLFNSNYLYGYRSAPSSIARNTIEINGSGETVSFTISIFNYHKQDINLVNQSDITYDLEIEASGAQGEDYNGYRVDDTSLGNDRKYTLNGETIKGRKAGINNYKITMPTIDLDYAQFKVMATVKNVSGGTGTNIYCLAAIIAPSRHSQVASPSVEGRLVESGNISDYDAYNYEITVGGNEADVKLEWSNEYIEIDPFFAKGKTITTENNLCVVEFHMDIGTKIIQFYRKGSTRPSNGSDLNISVTKT